MIQFDLQAEMGELGSNLIVMLFGEDCHKSEAISESPPPKKEKTYWRQRLRLVQHGEG